MSTTGALMLDLEGLQVSPDERELLLQPEVGGVIFFARSIASKAQFLSLVTQVRTLRPELLLAIDQEGGRVQRLREGYSKIPPMQVLGDVMASDPEQGEYLCRDAGWLMAVEIIASGLDFSFAPVLDLDRDSCEVISNRAFHDNPSLAVQALRPFIQGMNEAGMAATGKHFPGHGGVREDSHLETPQDTRSLKDLLAHDIIPFAELSQELAAVMPAHIVYSAVDKKPAGFSQIWLQDILRQRLRFDGVIFSDDLSMKGADIEGGYPEKTRAALVAGCDMVLVCNNRNGALEAVETLRNDKHQASEKLSLMRAQRSWTWSELESSARRDNIIAAITDRALTSLSV